MAAKEPPASRRDSSRFERSKAPAEAAGAAVACEGHRAADFTGLGWRLRVREHSEGGENLVSELSLTGKLFEVFIDVRFRSGSPLSDCYDCDRFAILIDSKDNANVSEMEASKASQWFG
jgi:hypothetical protein